MSRSYDIPVEVRRKFCKKMYNVNDEFRKFVDKNASDSYEERTVNNLMDFVTVYDIACYYNDVATGKEHVNDHVHISIEQEDKSC